jgi:hypothetical protein
MEPRNNLGSLRNQDLKKFENYRKNVASFVKSFVSLQNRIAVLQPYYRPIMAIFHFHKIYTSPKAILKNIFSIGFFFKWLIDLVAGS